MSHQSEGASISSPAAASAAASGAPASGSARPKPKVRIGYLDALRVIAIVLVVVNHTTGRYLPMLESPSLNWWLADIEFFACKMAVPLFVMVTGALLVGREDTYGKTGKRILRIVEALVLFSLFFYLVWEKDWSIGGFLYGLWHNDINEMYWYLYMYLGVLAMMPLLQKLASRMERRDYLYLFAICYGVVNLVPVIAAFFKPAALPSSLHLPLFSSFIGMLFLGHYLAHEAKLTRRGVLVAVVVFIGCLAFLSVSTRYFYDVNDGTKYLVLDDRELTPIVAMGASTFYLARYIAQKRSDVGRQPGVGAKIVREVGLCSFGIYLVHGLFRTAFLPWFTSLLGTMPDQAALLLYQLAVFVPSLAIVFVLRRIPVIKNIL